MLSEEYFFIRCAKTSKNRAFLEAIFAFFGAWRTLIAPREAKTTISHCGTTTYTKNTTLPHHSGTN